MRHSNTLWMLAIVTAIFVLIFLNLVLGSVSIPLYLLAYYLEFRK